VSVARPGLVTITAPVWRRDNRVRCGPATGDLFFSPPGERGPARAQRERAAKRLCRACPFRWRCASYALAYGQDGTWGGLTAKERRHLTAVKRDRIRRHAAAEHVADVRAGAA
jgi:WhiB family transcriptional regulator, redox-sensing transcriptional regulator